MHKETGITGLLDVLFSLYSEAIDTHQHLNERAGERYIYSVGKKP
jgi:hypothetical protein